MTENLLLHPYTESALLQALQSKPHAIMLKGNEGSGKDYTAEWLARNLLGASLSNHPYYINIHPDNGRAISIEQIRELKKFVYLKTTGKALIKRIAILTDAHTMTVEAQNALLKVLEEPPEDTILILTANSQKALMPTIYSRVQQIHIKPITKQQAVKYAAGEHSEIVDKAYLLSNGDAGLFISILQNDENHKLVNAIKLGKTLLSGTAFSRLQMVDELSKDKDRLELVMLAFKRICMAAIKQAADKHNDRLFLRWQSSLTAIYSCEKHLRSNVNVKLLLTDLFLAI